LLTKRFLFLVVLLLGVAIANAAPRVAVFSDDSTTGRELNQKLLDELRLAGFSESAMESVIVGQKATAGEALANPGELAIAVGPQALSQVLNQTSARLVIAVMLTRASLDEIVAGQSTRAGREVYAVVLDQPLARYLNLVRLALPQSQRIGVLLSQSQASNGLLKNLEKLAAEKDLSINVTWISEESTFILQVERLLSQSDILLALPDARVHNRNTVQPLLLTTYRAGVPVVAYSEAYKQAGALMSLYSTSGQLARQAAELAWSVSQGRSVTRFQAPRDFSVSVNDTVARSLGLSIPAGETLRERLKLLPD
jgi:ABC-type uncharacterized transport system substrate-binding protein